MAKKHVKSTDPRKPAIVAALKRKGGGTKVTLLVDLGSGVFEGDVQVYVGPGQGQPRAAIMGGPGSYRRCGRFQVTAQECGLE